MAIATRPALALAPRDRRNANHLHDWQRTDVGYLTTKAQVHARYETDSVLCGHERDIDICIVAEEGGPVLTISTSWQWAPEIVGDRGIAVSMRLVDMEHLRDTLGAAIEIAKRAGFRDPRDGHS